MRPDILTCTQKLTANRLNLPHGTKKTEKNKKRTKKQKPYSAEDMVYEEVHGVSLLIM